MVIQPGNGVEHSSYIRISSEAEFKEGINADGEYEVSFDQVATVALTPDAAEKFYWMLGAKIPELRRLATQ
ncbi:hypothetical protein F4560_008217 [Saccharothrix ecbatanensis]|uniref:Uncharacterized protein n=1 Tax=Saccharothrix ecbatanensis TaxID=1105145 RepID=A0A7W9HUY2_9PSEU|nr:hypothetical protein [Saccharothrix ecbatanensis]MBB5808449.1 hypothetical protein [Saccharothrix ecbatanensis]